MKVGYRRVSSLEQNLDRQELGAVERVFEEKVSAKTKERGALQEMIAFVREGDEIIVYSIDRLARDLRDLQDIIKQVNDKGCCITFLSENLTFNTNSDDPIAKFQLQMMGAFAEFERNIIRKRQAEGIAKAKERDVYKGRKRTIDKNKIYQLFDSGLTQTKIADNLSISRVSVFRYLKARR